MKRSGIISLLIILMLAAFACSGESGTVKDDGSTFISVQEISEVNPEKPVKIKLKRNGDGEYSWELSGDDVDRVIETDKRLLMYNNHNK